MISSPQVKLVQKTFQAIEPGIEAAGERFYQRLFELDPSTEALFPPNMQMQSMRFMAMLASAVQSLHQPETIIPLLQQLGQRHRQYGVTAAHYQLMEEALLWIVADLLGEQFTLEVQLAWTAAYRTIVKVMVAI